MLTTDTRDRASESFAGLDALEAAEGPKASRLRHLWSLTWPKLAAVAIGLFLWQCVVWSGWKPEYLLPGPAAVFSTLWEYIQEGRLQDDRTPRHGVDRVPHRSCGGSPRRRRRRGREAELVAEMVDGFRQIDSGPAGGRRGPLLR